MGHRSCRSPRRPYGPLVGGSIGGPGYERPAILQCRVLSRPSTAARAAFAALCPSSFTTLMLPPCSSNHPTRPLFFPACGSGRPWRFLQLTADILTRSVLPLQDNKVVAVDDLPAPLLHRRATSALRILHLVGLLRRPHNPRYLPAVLVDDLDGVSGEFPFHHSCQKQALPLCIYGPGRDEPWGAPYDQCFDRVASSSGGNRCQPAPVSQRGSRSRPGHYHPYPQAVAMRLARHSAENALHHLPPA